MATGSTEAVAATAQPGIHSFVVSGTRFDVAEQYKLIKPIGHGAYGVVVSANDEKNSDKVAIKKVPRAFDDLIDAKRILREIKLLRHFDHENVSSWFLRLSAPTIFTRVLTVLLVVAPPHPPTPTTDHLHQRHFTPPDIGSI